jgi:PAS domain S-box-containing protein
MKAKIRSEKRNGLRQKAEKLLPKKSADLRTMAPQDIEGLLHELQVHQVEMEMQNENLRIAQEEIEKSRSRYSDLYDFAPVGYFTFDEKGQILEANLTGARMLGLERTLLVNKSFHLFVRSESLDNFRSHRLLVLKSGLLQTCELELRKKDGKLFFARLESIPVKDPKGHFGQIRTAVIDITRQHQAEEALQAEHAFRQALADSVSSGLVAYDREGRQIYTNQAFCQMIGYAPEELIGAKPPYVYWPPEEEKSLVKTFQEIFSSEKPVGKLELRLKKRTGARFEVLSMFSPLKDSAGKPRGWVASIGDITETKKREEEVRRLNSQLEERVRRRTAELEAANEGLKNEILERKKAEASREKINHRMQVLSETAGQLLQNDDPAKILIDLCRKVMIALDCQVFFNYLVEEGKQRLRLNAYAGIPEQAARKVEFLDFGVAVCGCAARDALPIVVENIPETLDPRTDFVRSFGVLAYACHPLVDRGRVIGTLSFGTRSRTAFGTDELAVMKTISDRMSVAMERIRLYEEAKEQAGELQAIFDSLTDAVVVYDARGNPTKFKPPGNAASGGPFPIQDLRDSFFRKLSLRHPDGRVAASPEIPSTRALRGETVLDEILHFTTPEGREIIIRASASPILKDGKVAGAVTTWSDITRLKEVEEALQVSEERFRIALENSPITVFNQDRKLRYTWVYNPTQGFGKGDFAGKTDREVFPEDAARLAKIKNKILETGMSAREESFATVNGEVRFFDLNMEPLYDSAGSIVGITTAAIDLTARKKMEEELRRSRDELEVRVRERTQDLNERIEELNCLYLISNLLKKQDSPLEDLLQGVADTIPSGLRFPEITCAKITIRGREFKSKDFAESPWELRSQILLGGKPAGEVRVFYREEKPPSTGEGPFLKEERTLIDALAAQVGEFAERRQAEDALRESKEELLRLIAAVGQASESIVITDMAGVIQYVNPSFESIHGCRQGDALGKKFEEFLKRGWADEAIEAHIRDSVAEGRKWIGHLTRKKEKGAVMELDVAVSPVRDAGGKIINYLFVERDVTREMRLQETMHQSQKMEALGTLAGGIAHDFNNLLMSMVINTDLALMDIPGDSSPRASLEQVLKAAETGRALVKQIIAFSRPDLHEKHPIPIAKVIQESLKMVRASIPTSIDIRENLTAASGLARVSPDQIQQVLFNLCGNAAYAMRDRGGLLEVNLAEVDLDRAGAAVYPDLEPGPYLKLSVKDTGAGIEPMILDRIFDPFFTTKKKGEGTGMGLAVVHGIVKGCKGAVTVTSSPGQGATFEILLPRAEGQAEEFAPTALPPGRGERILLVDDEEAVLASVKSLLDRLGYVVTGVNDARKAWDIFRAEPDGFELVITDYVMPRMTGMQLAEKLLSLRRDLPIILATGYSEEVTEEEVKGLGIREFLLKPSTTQALAQIVRRVLNGGKP